MWILKSRVNDTFFNKDYSVTQQGINITCKDNVLRGWRGWSYTRLRGLSNVWLHLDDTVLSFLIIHLTYLPKHYAFDSFSLSSSLLFCSLQAWVISSASSSTSPATPETRVTRKTRIRKTTTTMAGPFTSAPSPSSWLNQWVSLLSTYSSRKTKRRASEPYATSLKPRPLLHHTLAFQVTAIDEGARDPVRVTCPASPLQWRWRSGEHAEEG